MQKWDKENEKAKIRNGDWPHLKDKQYYMTNIQKNHSINNIKYIL